MTADLPARGAGSPGRVQHVHEATFRPLLRSDFPSLQRWFAQAHVAQWWNADPAIVAIEAKYGPRIDGEDHATIMWVVEIGGAPCGLLQHYRHADHPDHDAAVGVADAVGIDFLLSEEVSGQGVGPNVLSAFADFVLEATPDTSCCVATPAQANRRSWRALEKAGFTRSGTCQPPDEPPAFTYVRTRA
jgi:aminoglycoside 6'-N-acetyltransferase